MNQILRRDWLNVQDGAISPARNYPPCPAREILPESHIINPLVTKHVRSRWLDIGLVRFCELMNLDGVEVHKHTRKELDRYPAILTEQAWSITHISQRKENGVALYKRTQRLGPL